MRTNLTNCDYQQINKGKYWIHKYLNWNIIFCQGIDLRCYPETEKVVLEQLWGSSCNRAVAYCLTVITFYLLLLAGIIMYETYQVREPHSTIEGPSTTNPWFVKYEHILEANFLYSNIGKNWKLGRAWVQARISNIQSFVSSFLSDAKYFHYHFSISYFLASFINKELNKLLFLTDSN